MTILNFEKFPEILVDGRRLVWDSRQPSHPNETVVIVPGLDPTVEASLRARTGAKIYDAPDARVYLAQSAAAHFGYPSRSLRLLGVTGTNGKTTCAGILRRLSLGEGHRTAEIGTLGVSIWNPAIPDRPEASFETGFTTPESPQLQHLLAQLRDADVHTVAMEVSSHAIALHRTDALDFDGALFTNLTQDHLDFHGTMEVYEREKAKLFAVMLPASVKPKKVAVLNVDDAAGKRILSCMPLGIRAVGLRHGREWTLEAMNLEGMRVAFADGFRVASPMIGRHNGENLALSLALMRELSPGNETAWENSLTDFKGARGRLERVGTTSDPVHVFVDYAHSPDALEKAIASLRETLAPGAKLVCVFGCGGDRDRLKRPIMGRIAAEGADRTIVTSDNPRTENPDAIVAEITAGVPSGKSVESVVDRRAAIARAVASLAPGDICLIAGKGHEEYQVVGKEKRHFSDFEEARKALDARSA